MPEANAGTDLPNSDAAAPSDAEQFKILKPRAPTTKPDGSPLDKTPPSPPWLTVGKDQSATSAPEGKTGYARERLHVGDGNWKWSEWFNPVDRVNAEAEEERRKLVQRGALPPDTERPDDAA